LGIVAIGFELAAMAALEFGLPGFQLADLFDQFIHAPTQLLIFLGQELVPLPNTVDLLPLQMRTGQTIGTGLPVKLIVMG
jgi:hypothetical protein